MNKPLKTKSAYLKSPWQFELREVDLPDNPPAGEALLRIEACGICGTDLTSAHSNTAEWKPFGHEIAAVIEQVPEGTPNLKPGDKVVLESSSYCGTCELCRNGRVDLCNKAPNFWRNPAMGFSERMLAPLACIVPRGELAPEIASLTEPAGVAFDMVKTAGIALGDEVCVIGPGPIALMAIPLALRSGAARVVCIGHSHSRRRLEVAEALGAQALPCDAGLETLSDCKAKFNHVLVTAPVEQIVPALSLLTYGGVLTYIGIGAGSGMISFDANNFHYRKLQLRASFASPAIYYPAVLKLLTSGIIPGNLLISHTFPLDQIAAAMTLARDDKANAVKIVVKP